MAHNTRKSVRTRLISSEDSRVCTICLSGIGETATPSKTCRMRQVAILPTCQHMFCVDCILEWSKQTNTCPIDRKKFNIIELWSLRKKRILNEIRVDDVLDSSLLTGGIDDLTYCEVCGRCDREDVLLLCDGCNQGYHIDCLRPQLDYIPLDVWFCDDCTPNIGRAFRWRINQRTRVRQSSREYENPQLPQLSEITQAASENSSGSEDPGRVRRRRKRYISPSSPSNSSDGDSEYEAQTLAVSIRRPPRRQVAKKPRKRVRRLNYSRRSEEQSDASVSSDVYTARLPKRLCRKSSIRTRYNVVARPIRRCKLKARENTRKLFRKNSLLTSPSSSTNTELINSKQPLSTQAVYTSSDQTDGETSDLPQRNNSLSEENRAIQKSDPLDSETDLVSDTDNVTSESEETLPDSHGFVPGTDPMLPDHTASDTDSTCTADEDDTPDLQGKEKAPPGANNPPPSNQPSDQPCSSHSDTSNSRSVKPTSRAPCLRPRSVCKKVRIFTPISTNTRNMAPRRAKIQAEQILLLQELFESDDVSD